MRRAAVCLAFLAATGCTGSTATTPVATGATTTTIGTTVPATPVSSTALPTAPTAFPPETAPDAYADERAFMVETQIVSRGVGDPVVLRALERTPRHEFVPEEYVGQAYDDHPLPIGYGQTISQPYIVGLMSEALGVEPGDRVLEVGTGSGYQAAVLVEMGLDVFTIEIIPELASRAGRTLDDLGYDVALMTGDGYFGWEEHGPFDGIIVTAAPDHVPQPLVDQLAPGARMVIPVGPIGAVQTLWVFTADEAGELVAESLGAVMFVPFTREGASRPEG